MANNWEDALKEAVQRVKKNVTDAGGKYFDSYEVLDELRRVDKGKHYVEYLAKYKDNPHPFRQVHSMIGLEMKSRETEFGIKQVVDADTSESIKVYISENIVGGSDAVQLWRIDKKP